MITAIKKIIKNDLNISADLHLLKYNTPISGTGLGTKVIFFVFKNREQIPSFVAKTVRSSRDAHVIKIAYTNLKTINDITKDSPFEVMFPRALFLSEDNQNILSIETFSPGKKISTNQIDDLLKIYTNFSKYIVAHKDIHHKKIIVDLAYGQKLISNLEGNEPVAQLLKKYNSDLWKDTIIELPDLPQHGDLTLDNVLSEKNNFSIVDCDLFGEIRVPGFDIAHLLRRISPKSIPSVIGKYFKEINIEYVPDKALLFIYFLHELNIKKDYILKGKTGESIIADFENMLAS